MSQTMTDVSHAATAESSPQHEVIVIGAGVAGIYEIKRLTDLGVNAVVLEAGEDLGGTWFWNRYPGARFDSESYTYGYSFSDDLLKEWHWKERFSSQPENLKYLNFVADKFDLRRHMRFNCRVASMRWDDSLGIWNVTLTDGEELTSRYIITGLGLLSTPTPPRYDGIDSFKGESFHTFHWPSEGVELEGKKVAVIGTGATAIQCIAEIADKVGSLTVFQRRPNWAAPLNNSEITDEEMTSIRQRYDEIFETCSTTPGGFEHAPDRRGFYNLSREERVAMWDRLYDEPGFGIWLQNFVEIFVDEEANAEFSEYIADRIRGRVNDPEVAEKLIPKDHGFGIQRVPLETNYYEAYNRDNVELVDISESPIECLTEDGLRTTDREFDFDLIVFATGFDAMTGTFNQIDIEGIDGQKLRDRWKGGPSTYLGIMVAGFPNFMMLGGPQSGSASTNFPRGIESGGDWVTEMLEHAWANDHTRLEATAEAEADWTQHVADMYATMLMRKAKSWFTGYNSNVEGHEEGTIRYFVYNGGGPKFVRRLNEVREAGYEGIEMS